MTVERWARGPFELLVHAELHYRAGSDFDKRVALISYDNSVEVAVSTYLSLHPAQRNGKTYERADVTAILVNFHTKLEFLVRECDVRQIALPVPHGDFIHYHTIRNELYHGGHSLAPDWSDLTDARGAACWVTSFLFDIPDITTEIDQYLASLSPLEEKPERDDLSNKVIDDAYGLLQIGDAIYEASELLYMVDPQYYTTLAASLRQNGDDESQLAV